MKNTEVPLDKDKRSRGYGIVYFETMEDAEKAIEQFNDREVNKRKLRVRLEE